MMQLGCLQNIKELFKDRILFSGEIQDNLRFKFIIFIVCTIIISAFIIINASTYYYYKITTETNRNNLLTSAQEELKYFLISDLKIILSQSINKRLYLLTERLISKHKQINEIEYDTHKLIVNEYQLTINCDTYKEVFDLQRFREALDGIINNSLKYKILINHNIVADSRNPVRQQDISSTITYNLPYDNLLTVVVAINSESNRYFEKMNKSEDMVKLYVFIISFSITLLLCGVVIYFFRVIQRKMEGINVLLVEQNKLHDAINNSFSFNKKLKNDMLLKVNEKLSTHELWEKAGMDCQDAANKMLLPTKKGAEISTTDRSIHQGRHLKEVKNKLEAKMDEVIDSGEKHNYTEQQYAEELKEIIEKERTALKTGKRMLNKNARSWAEPINKD